jgi:hypothetical protein
MVSENGLESAVTLGLLIRSHSSSAEYHSSSSRLSVPLRQVLLGERVDGPPARGPHWTRLGEDWLLKGA